MTKDEIRKEIYKLDSDKEIEEFIKNRIAYLEKNSKDDTVGQGYTQTYKEYISKKTHYKVDDFEDFECPDLVYDDIKPYINLIYSLKRLNNYNDLVLFSEIYYVIHEYLPSKEIEFARAFTYMSHRGRQVSIKTISENECASSSEKAGLAHNMFKFLGIDSSIACGYRNDHTHTFNLLYPKGYDKEPTIIYDPSHHVSFEDDNMKLVFAYYMALKGDGCQDIINRKPIKIDLTRTELNYRHQYSFDGSLDEKRFHGDRATYCIGINKKVSSKKEN